MTELIGTIVALVGLANAGLSCAIWFRIGELVATQHDHDRRLSNLERRRAA